MKKILVAIYVYLLLLLKPFRIKKGFYNHSQTIQTALKDSKSIIRFGDGEFRIMFAKKGIEYQDYDSELAKELLEIFIKYSKDEKYLICIPKYFYENINFFIKNDKKYAYCFSAPRFHFRKIRKRNISYGDAFCFSKERTNNYTKLCEGAKDVIFVHNDEKWSDLLRSQLNCKVHFIKIPAKNSYSEIDRVEREILDIKQQINHAKILVCAGPMAKALIYRLSKNDVIAYDTGHCFDAPLEE